MMTLKHRTPSGVECVYQINRLTYEPSNEIDGRQARTVTVHVDGAPFEFYTEGVFYVMNDAGATVAKYDLG